MHAFISMLKASVEGFDKMYRMLYRLIAVQKESSEFVIPWLKKYT
jgi:hypothetical protein